MKINGTEHQQMVYLENINNVENNNNPASEPLLKFELENMPARNADDICSDLLNNLNHSRIKVKDVERNISEIDKTNVVKIWDKSYNYMLKTFGRNTHSLATHLIERLDRDTATKFLNHIVVSMRDAAKDKGVDLTKEINEYNKATARSPHPLNIFGKISRKVDIDNSIRHMYNKIILANN